MRDDRACGMASFYRVKTFWGYGDGRAAVAYTSEGQAAPEGQY
jgi:hypothetical protein